MLAQGSTFEEAFLVGVSVAVAAVPEGLAATVTIALALGARAMAARGAIAPADRSRDPGQRDGDRLRQDGDAHREPAAGRRAAAGFRREGERPPRRGGSRVERAPRRRRRARTYGRPGRRCARTRRTRAGALARSAHAERTAHPRASFDPVRKRMTLVYEESDGFRAYVKGAPEVVFERSTSGHEARRAGTGRRLVGGRRPEGARDRGAPPARCVPGRRCGRVRSGLVGVVALHDPLRASARGYSRRSCRRPAGGDGHR